MDPYCVLGLSANSTSAEVKQSYKKLAMIHHPDRGGSSAEFKKITNAYNQIINSCKSAVVDMHQPHHYNPVIRVTVSIDLADAVIGGPQYISIPVASSKQHCEILVPAGISNGQSLRYANMLGHIDVIVTFRFMPHSVWQVDGTNLSMRYPISIWDLIVGTTITITTVQNETLLVKVPPKTNPGTVLRVHKQGIVPYNPALAVGDILIQLDGKIPDLMPDDLYRLINDQSGCDTE